jgi:hypothetical protein
MGSTLRSVSAHPNFKPVTRIIPRILLISMCINIVLNRHLIDCVMHSLRFIPAASYANVAVSISYEVIEFFDSLNPFSHTMALGLIQLLTECSWGGGGIRGQRITMTTLPPAVSQLFITVVLNHFLFMYPHVIYLQFCAPPPKLLVYNSSKVK